VAAALLTSGDREVVGVSMVLPGVYEDTGRGADGARGVCEKLGIDHHVVDLSEDFEGLVVGPFCREYLAGRTPNPCVVCNEKIKFGRLLEFAESLGAERIATGHYASVEGPGDRQELMRAADRSADQSYFLWRLDQERLERVVFPLGDTTREEVRGVARARDLGVHERASSQDICFLQDGDYRDLLRKRCPEADREGDITDSSGKVLGRHEGIAFFTVGQREGLRIAWSEPLYVVGIEPGTNTLVVGTREETLSTGFRAAEANWVSIPPPEGPVEASVRVRYNQTPLPGVVSPLGDGGLEVEFLGERTSITPGQSAVFYEGDRLLGGGVIVRGIRERST
jgi:tRNA-specific 2-thiouridylase